MGGRGSGPSKMTTEKMAAFCAAVVSTGGNITRACVAVDLARETVYRWREESPEFSAAFEKAKNWGIEALEDEARRRAFEGTAEPVFYLGEEVGTVQKYSDTLTIFLLKGAMPEKYRERAEIKHDVVGQLAERMAKAKERAKRD